MHDRIASLVQSDRVSTRIYADAEIFEEEMNSIFGKVWVYVGHASEVPRPGDYKTTVIGRVPVIMVRGDDGEILVHQNRCRHRGALVCMHDSGNARRFQCPYHGWTYSKDGSLAGTPFADGYDGQDISQLGLVALPAVDQYAGLVFASLNPDVEPLLDQLGPAVPHIDAFFAQGNGYPLEVAGYQPMRYKANWKIQMDNASDGYHLPFVHRSYIDAIRHKVDETVETYDPQHIDRVIYLGNGHTLLDLAGSSQTYVQDTLALVGGEEALRAELEGQVDDVDAMLKASVGSGVNLGIFPNLGLCGAFLRESRPVAPSLTDQRHAAFRLAGAPEAVNRIRLRIHEVFQGPAGFGSPDDMEVWERVQRGIEGVEDGWIMFNRGLNREVVEASGIRVGHGTDEGAARGVYEHWSKVLAR